MALSTAQSLAMFYSQIPRGLETPLLILLIYGVYLVISAAILIIALRTAGGSISYIVDFPKAIFTIIIRDLIAIPLVALVFAAPLLGIIFAFAIWLGILRYLFQITWPQAFLAWILGGIINIILIALVVIPLILFF